MAIDSEDKRRSAIRILPIPDGSIAGLDKQHAIGHYRLQVVSVAEPIEVVGYADVEMIQPYLRVEIQ